MGKRTKRNNQNQLNKMTKGKTANTYWYLKVGSWSCLLAERPNKQIPKKKGMQYNIPNALKYRLNIYLTTFTVTVLLLISCVTVEKINLCSQLLALETF